MTTDLKYDIDNFDIAIENGDFVIQSNTSEQIGAIMLYASGITIENPTFGIGLENLINNGVQNIQFHLNRWVQQCLNDGAKSAKWENVQTKDGIIQQCTVNYD